MAVKQVLECDACRKSEPEVKKVESYQIVYPDNAKVVIDLCTTDAARLVELRKLRPPVVKPPRKTHRPMRKVTKSA